jgi:hypothetical protein
MLPSQQRALQVGRFRDQPRMGAMQHVRVPPEDAGRAARCIEQHRVNLRGRLPV